MSEPNGVTPADPPGDHPELVPARMLNEYVYCPRLAYLEWVQGEFVDSVDTVDGRFQHRRVDVERGALPEPDAAESAVEGERLEARSVMLSAEGLGLVARIDLIEVAGGEVAPVDYKRGAPPDLPNRAWAPERVQLCAQGLILRENGYSCSGGVLYFVAAKTRVEVVFDDALVALTLEALDGLRKMAAQGRIPAPLVDSPKCPRCSLNPICLPDELQLLNDGITPGQVRRLFPSRDEGMPLYVREPGAVIGKKGDVLEVRSRERKTLDSLRLLDATQVSVFGNVTVTAAALRELAAREIPLCHFSSGGWFFAMTRGLAHKNIELRRAQFRRADDPKAALALSRAFVVGKIKNCRTLLRRNHPDRPTPALTELVRLARSAARAASLDSLLGLEGAAAKVYFAHFAGMLKPTEASPIGTFDFNGRNRRPPRDPVNALLSLAYSLLTKELTLAASAVGLDPYLGFYHQPRYGKPALALDLMEEFRPIVADSVVLTAINNGEVRAPDFVVRGRAAGLTAPGRRRFIECFERRLDELITHPLFGYSLAYRRVIQVQARLLARYVAGELTAYPAFRTR